MSCLFLVSSSVVELLFSSQNGPPRTATGCISGRFKNEMFFFLMKCDN